MRDYKFRGKRVDNGEWVVGTGIVQLNYHDSVDYVEETQIVLHNGHTYPVIEETVGRYTGHKINEIDLYEGDIIRQEISNEDGDERIYIIVEWIEEWGMFGGLNIHDGEYIDYLEGGADKLDESSFWTFPIEVKSKYATISICGNIHSNPELLSSK